MRILPYRPQKPLPQQAKKIIKNYDNLPEDKKSELKKLYNACLDFESIFTYQIIKEMKKTINKTKLIDGGFAEEIFTDFLDQERARDIHLGLADMLFWQLSKAVVPVTSQQNIRTYTENIKKL